MSLIKIENIYKIYGDEGFDNEVRALDGVSLDIESGEFVAIIGASGSGKSTMMNMLGCLDVPTRGQYYLDGIPISERTQRELAEIRSLRIGFIFQGYNLIPSLNVWQNVALPMTYQKIKPAERYQRAMEALEKVDIAEKAEKRPSQLSGGQQQRVAIARAIATHSPIIMADEPTGALDSKTGVQVLGILRQLNEEGTTIILITHDNSIAAQAKRIVRMKDGKIINDSARGGDPLAGVTSKGKALPVTAFSGSTGVLASAGGRAI
ncbi:MAG: ABC transporter ATP-binding protein [Oscillospiraceae bacterium]